MKRKWLILAAIATVVVVVIGWAADLLLAGWARNYIIARLNERFDSDVRFTELNVSIFPHPRISGGGVIVRHKHLTSVPPLIEVRRFSADASLFALLHSPRHVSKIYLEGLRIQIPPRRQKPDHGTSKRQGSKQESSVVVDEIVTNDAELDMLPKRSDKLPLQFLIHHLRMEAVVLNQPAPFRATLTNPKPIVANLRGHFTLRNGIVTFSNLKFSVPGTFVQLSGTYGLRDGELNFKGTCQLEAKLSQTTGGVKSFFLKLADPLFHKHGVGTVLPIKITGTREHPSLGLNIG